MQFACNLENNDFILFTNRFDEPLYFLSIHGCFSFYSQLYGYNFTIFKILIFTFSHYFFCIPGTHNSHGARSLDWGSQIRVHCVVQLHLKSMHFFVHLNKIKRGEYGLLQNSFLKNTVTMKHKTVVQNIRLLR